MAATPTTIDSAQHVATLINVFSVDPETQQQLVELLVEATEQVMQHQPGFVSANIHSSQDGTRVVNYAQWRSEDDFRAMLQNSAAQHHMNAASELATTEPRLYAVASTHHA